MSSPVDDDLVDRLRSAGCVFAEEEAELLLERAAGPEELELLTTRRVAGEPLEWLLGYVDFGGRRLSVGPGVFVPRQRSVALVEAAVAELGPAGLLIELCAGSAAIAAVIGARRPGVDVVAAELDPVAAAYARRNLPGGTVVVGDLFAPLPTTLRGRADVIVCNAPYVPSGRLATMPAEARDFEPRPALDGGPEGVDVHRQVLAGARRWLSPSGVLLIESTAAQVELVLPELATCGLTGGPVEVGEQVILRATPTGPAASIP